MGEGGGTEARGVPDATIESRGGESTSSSEGGGGAMESGERTKGEGKGAAEMAQRERGDSQGLDGAAQGEGGSRVCPGGKGNHRKRNI